MNHTPPAWAGLPAGSHRLTCPHCGKESRRDRTLGVTIEHDGAGVAHCFRCEYVETYRPDRGQQAHHQPVPRIYHPPTTPPQKHTTLNEAGRELWRAASLITPDTPAFDYLVARNCMLPHWRAGHLRWLPDHRHPSGYRGHCLVALLTDAATREAKSLHFTWIQPNGQKAAVEPPRLLLKGHVKAGTVCRLWPDSDVTYGLAIAEGIETALSLAHAYRPAWACVDAGNLSAFPVLPGVESLLIACDRDPAGEKAAATCASRWVDEGREVLITRQSCNDLNDLVQIAATDCEVVR